MIKIAHISDLHFGFHRQEIIPIFLKDLEQYNPENIIISGDLTHRGRREQFVELTKFISSLPCRSLIVPGNHDIPFKNFWARFIHPFKYFNRYIQTELEPHFNSSQLRILGLNSVNPYTIKDGRLNDHSLKTIPEFFNASTSPAFDILFFHHNFDYLEGLHKPLHNEKVFLNYLKGSSIKIVCTGHLHFAHVSLLKKHQDESCIILHAGSLLCQRTKDGYHSYFTIEVLNLQECLIEWRVLENDNCFKIKETFHINFTSTTSLSPRYDVQ